SSLLPRRLDCGFTNVRLVCTSQRRVAEIGILSFSTWPSSIVSPVLIRRTPFSSVSGIMWLPEPRSSPAPHFDGQRWLSAGGFHDWAWAAVINPTVRATPAMPTVRTRMADLLLEGPSEGAPTQE